MPEEFKAGCQKLLARKKPPVKKNNYGYVVKSIIVKRQFFGHSVTYCNTPFLAKSAMASAGSTHINVIFLIIRFRDGV
jgi:hypothetical protein